MLSKQMYILIGNDKTGKTSFQKELLKLLCDINKDKKLESGAIYDITHPYSMKSGEKLFIGNRSYQEKKAQDNGIKSVKDYFDLLFKDADICIISSHLVLGDIKEMIELGNGKGYNVIAVFFQNSREKHPIENKQIGLLNWDERLCLENKTIDANDKEFDNRVGEQIRSAARQFAHMIINRMSIS